MYSANNCSKHLEFEKLQNSHTKTVAHLEAKVSGLIDELDSAREEQENMKEKLERQELLLSQWKEKAKSSPNTTFLEVEMGTLQNTVTKLERENEELIVKVCTYVCILLLNAEAVFNQCCRGSQCTYLIHV